MVGRMVVALLAGLAVTVAAFAQAPRVTDKAGDWVKVEAGGLVVFRTTEERSGSAIEIACDEAMSLDHSGTGIAIEIGGKMLPPNAQLRFTVDRQTITIPTAGSGGVRTRGCPECAYKFAQLWSLVRDGDHLEVTAADARRATFSLRGTAELMPAEPCSAGW